MYNISVRPFDEDLLRGGNDGFGWPLSLATLGLKNLGGLQMVSGTRLPTFDPSASTACAPRCTTGGLFAATAQDPRINPGFGARVLRPRLPAFLAPWIPPLTLGRAHPELDEVEGGFNTQSSVPVMNDGAIESKGLSAIDADLKAIDAIADKTALSRALGEQVRADTDPLNSTNFDTEHLFGVFVAQSMRIGPAEHRRGVDRKSVV